MMQSEEPDWDPLSDAVLRDPPAAYDEMRRRCPVAYSTRLGWSLFRHADVARVLDDHETFSNVVSDRRAVPNGMDPPEHTSYRRALEPFFGPVWMARFEPTCRALAASVLAEALTSSAAFDAMEQFAVPFAVRCQCAFLGWPEALVEPMGSWTRRQHEATLAGDRAALAAAAAELRAHVSQLLETRRTVATEGDDVTSHLMRAQVNGAALTDVELASIFRNWTVGEVGSMAVAIGVVTRALAVNNHLWQTLHTQRDLLPAAIDEILRVTSPLVLNQRVTTRDVVMGGRFIAAGQRLSLIWPAANRDAEVFDAAEEARLDRDPRCNLLFGAGIHVCPGAPLARLELRVAIEALLHSGRRIELDAERPARRATYPSNGWATLPVRIG